MAPREILVPDNTINVLSGIFNFKIIFYPILKKLYLRLIGNNRKGNSLLMKKNEKINKPIKMLGEILIYYKILTLKQLKEALEIQKNTEKRVGEILIDIGYVTQDEINWVLSKQLDIPYVTINIDNIDIRLFDDIPELTLRKFKALPILKINDELIIAMADPTDKEAVITIQDITKRKLRFVLASFKNINDTIDLILKK